jgi:DNA polymerase I-like protein with 3'-5' exonuclease and polymerase domains
MIDAFNEGFKIRITVHDENVFSVESKKEARQIAEVMNNAVDLVVPVVCDLEYGRTWGACKAI